MLKSLILEENEEVFRALKSHLRNPVEPQKPQVSKRFIMQIDDLTSHRKQLIQLVQRHKDAVVRPNSSLRINDQVIRLAENLFRQRARDETYVQTLQKLVRERDELVFSAFDVFKSDHDEDDLFDTLSRIIQLSHQKARSKRQAEGYFPGSQKQQSLRAEKVVNNYVEVEDGERGRKIERTRSKEASNGVANGGLSKTKSPFGRDLSYFLR